MPDTLREKSISGLDRGLATEQMEMLAIVQGFLPASVLFALQRLGIFERIGSSERSTDELAAEIGGRAEHLVRLLNAGVVLGLLESDDGSSYRVPSIYQRLLVASEEPGFLGDWVRFMESWYVPFASLDQAVLRGGATNMYEQDQAIIRRNTLAMHNFASVRGKELADFIDAAGCNTMLDVGCGPGTYSFELGFRNPHLALSLLDLPAVLEITREIAATYQLSNEISYLPTDLADAMIAGSYDLVLVSNALQAFDEVKIRSLIRQLYAVLNSGGSVVVQAQFLADDHVGPRWPIFVDLGCLCFTPGGRNHSMAETRIWLEEAGFADIEERRMSRFNANSFVRGYKR